jgi:microtubule-associated protein-like 6
MGASVHEISAVDGSDMRGGPIACGHSAGELRGVITHPSKHEFITVGDDRRLRIWDLSTHTLLKIGTFDAEIRAAAYSPLGDSICVGLGYSTDSSQSTEEEKAGAFVIISEEDLSILFEGKDSRSPVSCAEYSIQGDTLAVAVEDGSIFLYAVQDEYEFIGKCVRHTTPVTRIDFSLDGEWIRSNSIDRDICFWSTDDASIQSNLQSMRDVEWAKLNCPYTWHTKGVHYSTYKDEAASAVDVPLPIHDADYFVCGTSYGYIRVHNYPCIGNNVAPCHKYPAHVNSVGNVKFSFDGLCMLSAGQTDRCLIQWKAHRYPLEPVDIETQGSALLADQTSTEEKGNNKKKPVKSNLPPPAHLPENKDLSIEAKEGAELQKEFMPDSGSLLASKMNLSDPSCPAVETTLKSTSYNNIWMDSVVDPSYPPIPRTEVPNVSLRLEYAYGYRCQEMRNSVRYNSDGNVVYVCSTLAVTINRATKIQSFFQHHTDAIISFATSTDGVLAATGQLGSHPFIAVWNTVTCEVISSLKDIHVNGICALKFSPNNSLLAVVSLDEQHTISVYDWYTDCLISRSYGGMQRVYDVCFSPCGNKLVTCGDQDIKLWNNVQIALISSSRPTIGDLGTISQQFLCCVYFDSYPIIATQDGNLYIFENDRLRRSVKAHTGPVSCLDVSSQGNFLVSGGRDGIVRVWNVAFDCMKEINIMDVLGKTQSVKVRSVAFNRDGRDLVIATRGAEIFEVHISDASLKGKVLVKGHGVRALWGLATHPTKEEFATCGDDATVRIWDAKNYSSIHTIPLEIGARAVAYSFDGKYLAVGFGTATRAKGKYIYMYIYTYF